MNDQTYTQDDIAGLECKHVVYVTAQDRTYNDLLFVKERVHLKDGRTIPRTRFLENYKRDYWVTIDFHRNHKDKKEWEDISKLRKFQSTQIDLVKNASRALGVQMPANGQLRMLARSPYLYGCDITTPAIIKYGYRSKYKDCNTTNTVAVSDIETDMLTPNVQVGDEKIIMQSVTMKNRVLLVILKDFFKGWDLDTLPQMLHDAMMKYMGDTVEKRGIKLEVVFVDYPFEIVETILQACHSWQPDFLSFWNMDYDITYMQKALVDAGRNLADIWSDPSVPERYRYFKYKQGPNQKVTASGDTMPLSPAEQWHTVHTPASFYVIDSMCVYQKLRIAKGKAPSYALDAILATELKDVRKMHFAETDHLKKAEWHIEMQRNYKIEYCIYNIFDCVSVEILDEKTTDLARQITDQCEHSEYSRFPSQPRRTCDDLHFFTLNLNPQRVCATTSDRMVDELDQYVIGHDNWIVTLRSDLIHDDGIVFVEEFPDQATLFRRDVADLDVEGTYPTEEMLFNISKETTRREMAAIQGVSEPLQRAIGINLSGGYVNAVEVCTAAFKAPTFDQLLAYYRGEDIYPPEFDENLRNLYSHMASEEVFIEEDEEVINDDD